MVIAQSVLLKRLPRPEFRAKALADVNRIEISGVLAELDAVRYTPSGIPVVQFRLAHESTQEEAGNPRRVICEIYGIAFEREARLLSGLKLGAELTVQGFLDRKSRGSGRLTVHATHIEFRN